MKKIMTAIFLMSQAAFAFKAQGVFRNYIVESVPQVYKSYRSGSAQDVKTASSYGLALMGGGSPVDEGFRWLINKSAGGDILVIRFTDDPWMNDYFLQLGSINSVETLVIQSQEAAAHPEVIRKIAQAEALFFPGGDQSNYYINWKASPMARAIEIRARSGVPVGGTSAGLAILGQVIFTAEKDTITSEETLLDPYLDRITLADDFLNFHGMQKILTDTHFKERDRMGRFLTFLARAKTSFPYESLYGLAVDERTVVFYEPKKPWIVVGEGSAYKAKIYDDGFVCEPQKKLTLRSKIRRLSADGRVADYHVMINDGVLSSDQANGEIY